ncbi:hypothetical protein Tco_0051631 [Tanacetum coccineum]
MSTQQNIYAAGSENHPPMHNKDNYVLWSSRLLHYVKSKPNGKLIYNSIVNGPYVRRMIPEPGEPDREVPFAETFHEQTDEELIEKEEIWLHVQQMMKGSDIGIQKKKAKLFIEWERFTSTDRESIESYLLEYARSQLIGIQLLQLELRLGKTPSRSFRHVKSARASCSFRVSLAHDGS